MDNDFNSALKKLENTVSPRKTHDLLSLKNNESILKMIQKESKNGEPEEIFFSDFMVKINSRDKPQERVILVTSKAIYNLMPNDYKKCKRRVPFSLIDGVTISKVSDEFVMHIPLEYDYRMRCLRKADLLQCLEDQYKSVTGNDLAVTSTDEDDLKRVCLTRRETNYRKDGGTALPFMLRIGRGRGPVMSKEAQTAAIKREKEIIAKAKQQAQQSNMFDWASGDQATDVTIDDFDLLKVIGRGSFGKVMLVKGRATNELFAMKILKKEAILQRNQVEHTRAEREILASIDHPFLVKLHYAFQNDTKLYMIIDFCKGGELFYHLKNARRFPESRVQIYVGEITLGLEHLHSKGIIYRDLKPENVLLDFDGHLKLTDFGLSKLTNGEQALTFCGTPEYLAPEIIKGGGHGKEVDWWSLGVLMFEMLVGMSPFYSENQSAMYRMIQSSDVRIPSHISRNARDITQRLLTRDVTRRIGYGERDGNEIREHVFFESINWENLLNRKVDAPFIPSVLSDDDCANFDEEFTCEPVVDSYAQKGKILQQNADAFQGFEFDGPSGNQNGASSGALGE